jgi:hypothetical protein
MRRGVFFTLFLVTAISLFSSFLIFRHSVWARPLVEIALNKTGKEFFQDSLRLGHFHIDRRLGIHLKDLRGNLRTETGEVPFEIHSLDTENSLANIFQKKGLKLFFKAEEISGEARYRTGKGWFFDLKLDIHELGLEEVKWINPENLSGASGRMKGRIEFRADAQNEIHLQADLGVGPPGGLLQARFFELLKPYLPEPALRVRLEEVLAGKVLVGFKDASLKMELLESDIMKIFFHIAVPDYNLNLNLNMEIRIDEKNGFRELAELAGVLK